MNKQIKSFGSISFAARSDPARRLVLRGGAAALAGLLAGCEGSAPVTTGWPIAARPLLGFRPVPVSDADRVTVPKGYRAVPFAAWGEPVGIAGQMPGFRNDAGNSAAEQAVQLGMNHDGLQYYPLDGSRRGLLVMNHEYVDNALLHADGGDWWSAEKVAKAQAAHGISVIEVEGTGGGEWRVVRPSLLARRITGATPCALTGPAAGHRLLRTEADPSGRTVLGTIANCAAGSTPWGTYLSGEENWAGYFDAGDTLDEHQRRWELRARGHSRWAAFDPRFDAARHPHEPNRFGWIVEVDPMDPHAIPRKRTALGRAAHEGAWVAVTRQRRAVVYSGEDAPFEYIYRFVSRDAIAPASPGRSAAQANRDLLDHGTLSVARFDADGSGRWLPLVHGTGPLDAAHGFADQGDVVVKARQAADLLGATPMDRPEWLAIDPRSRDVYCTLTGNPARGEPGRPGPAPANPRSDNRTGQIVRWREDGDFDSPTFRWTLLLLAGDPAASDSGFNGDGFANPDGLMLDARGVLWIQTDSSASSGWGNNQMLACDPRTGEVRRFLTGPRGCEITGAAMTPDGRALFVNVQHPGESSGSGEAGSTRYGSTWPDGGTDSRPRSATVVITRADGALIGT